MDPARHREAAQGHAPEQVQKGPYIPGGALQEMPHKFSGNERMSWKKKDEPDSAAAG